MTAGFSLAPKGHHEDISRQSEEPADSSTLGRVYLTPVLPQQRWAGGPMASLLEVVMVTMMAGKAGTEQEGPDPIHIATNSESFLEKHFP